MVMTLTGFEHTNRVKVLYAMDGDSLEWVEPLYEPGKEPIYIPEEPQVPPWVDSTVSYIPEDYTYVDGEWVNLNLIEISGNKTIADIDLNGDGDIPQHEILVYFAKYTVAQN